MNETSINTVDLSWEKAESYPDGTMVKTLRRNSSGNAMAILLKLPPGFEMDDHSHVANEQHFILEGEYQDKFKHYFAGHYRMIPEHTIHGSFRSETGAVVLVVWESISVT